MADLRQRRRPGLRRDYVSLHGLASSTVLEGEPRSLPAPLVGGTGGSASVGNGRIKIAPRDRSRQRAGSWPGARRIVHLRRAASAGTTVSRRGPVRSRRKIPLDLERVGRGTRAGADRRERSHARRPWRRPRRGRSSGKSEGNALRRPPARPPIWGTNHVVVEARHRESRRPPGAGSPRAAPPTCAALGAMPP